MKIELRPTEKVRPYEHNPRLNDGAVAAVARSLSEFGFRQPIVVDAEGVIIVGHTRWKAAQSLGLKKVPVHVADLDETKARAYRIADNQTATIAEWDMDLLPQELRDLEGADFDLSILGWSPEDLDAMLAEVDGSAGGNADADAAACSVHERTLYRWLAEPAFKRAFREARREGFVPGDGGDALRRGPDGV